jgi:hypothetical protein
LETDDPGTPGSGHLELNVALEIEREGEGTNYDAPRIDANLGIGTRLQLKAEVPLRVRTRPGEAARSDLGNLVVGLKWRFAETGTLAVSTYPQVTLQGAESARAKDLAESEAVLVPLEIAWQSEPLSINAELGYEIGRHESEMVFGLALGRRVGRRVELLGECHGSASTDLGEIGMLCGAGFRYALHHAVSALAAFTAGVFGSEEDRPDYRVYTGVQVRW